MTGSPLARSWNIFHLAPSPRTFEQFDIAPNALSRYFELTHLSVAIPGNCITLHYFRFSHIDWSNFNIVEEGTIDYKECKPIMAC